MDLAASLWPVAVDIQLGDWVYQIPAEPASVWIEAIADPDGGAIVPGLLEPEDQHLVWRDYMRGHIRATELSDAWRWVVTEVAGRPWWEATRLVLSATTRDNWPFISGKIMQRGVDLERYSLGAFCNLVHVMALEACEDASARSQYEFELSTPPPGVEPDEAHRSTDAAADFLTAMQQFQTIAPRSAEGGPAREVR